MSGKEIALPLNGSAIEVTQGLGVYPLRLALDAPIAEVKDILWVASYD